jgi:hypothetical protein
MEACNSGWDLGEHLSIYVKTTLNNETCVEIAVTSFLLMCLSHFGPFSYISSSTLCSLVNHTLSNYRSLYNGPLPSPAHVLYR